MRSLIFTLLFITVSVSTYATQYKKTVKLRIQSYNGNLDEATVYFDQNINPTYTYQEDAQYVVSGVAGVPSIYTVTTDNIHCSINGYGTLSNSEVVPVGISVDFTGHYNITAALLDNFDPTSIITLEDRSIGRFIDLRTNFYPVQLDSGAAPEGRFFIHVSYPSAHSSTIAGCANNDAELNITNDPSVTWNSLDLYDAFNNAVGGFSNVNGPVTFTGLAQGDYYMIRTYGQYSTNETFHVNGTYIAAHIGASDTLVSTLQNISFSAVAINANHFAWDFGDGTLINGVAHPDLAYYEPGVYTVNLICSNDHGCSTVSQIQITVTEAVSTGIKEETNKDVTVVAQGKTVMVNMNNTLTSGSQLQIYNLIGQPVYNAPVTNEITTASLDAQPAGYYLVSVKSNDKTNTKRIFIGK